MTADAVSQPSEREPAQHPVPREFVEWVEAIWAHLLKESVAVVRGEVSSGRANLQLERNQHAEITAANQRDQDSLDQASSLLSGDPWINTVLREIDHAQQALAEAVADFAEKRRVVDELQRELSAYEERLARALDKSSADA